MVVALLVTGGPGHALSAPIDIPEGYRLAGHDQIGQGLDHLALVSDDPAQVVNVARIAAGSPFTVRSILSNDRVGGPAPLERTSSICARIQCLVGINADFAEPRSGEPFGAVVSLGEVMRSQTRLHHQLVIGQDGTPRTTSELPVTATLATTDLQDLAIDGVNVARSEDEVILYTQAFGPSTRTNRHGAELLLEIVQPEGPVRLGRTSLVRLVDLRTGEGSMSIPRGGAVLSGHGDGARRLAELWDRVDSGGAAAQGFLRLESSADIVDSVGGTPILVRGGRRWFEDEATLFVRGSHPRSIAGWNERGDILLVTVDGRQPERSVGMSLGEAADLMIALGATEAINLDGGGSTTFVKRTTVMNRPSDRMVRRAGEEEITPLPEPRDRVLGHVERPVASALVVVPRTAVPLAAPPVAPGPAEDPQALAARAPIAADVASNPESAQPVPPASPGTPAPPKLPASAAAVLAFAAALVVLFERLLPSRR